MIEHLFTVNKKLSTQKLSCPHNKIKVVDKNSTFPFTFKNFYDKIKS